MLHTRLPFSRWVIIQWDKLCQHPTPPHNCHTKNIIVVFSTNVLPYPLPKHPPCCRGPVQPDSGLSYLGDRLTLLLFTKGWWSNLRRWEQRQRKVVRPTPRGIEPSPAAKNPAFYPLPRPSSCGAAWTRAQKTSLVCRYQWSTSYCLKALTALSAHYA